MIKDRFDSHQHQPQLYCRKEAKAGDDGKGEFFPQSKPWPINRRRACVCLVSLHGRRQPMIAHASPLASTRFRHPNPRARLCAPSRKWVRLQLMMIRLPLSRRNTSSSGVVMGRMTKGQGAISPMSQQMGYFARHVAVEQDITPLARPNQANHERLLGNSGQRPDSGISPCGLKNRIRPFHSRACPTSLDRKSLSKT